MGTQETVFPWVLQISGYINEVPEIKDYLDAGIESSVPDTLTQNVTFDECQHHQLQHKKLQRDI